MIQQSQDPSSNIVKRIQHHLLHKASLIVNQNNPTRASNGIGGDSVWRCYNAPGAGFYIQIGRSPSAVSTVHPGGHLGCYWNPHTVTQSGQIENYEQVHHYVAYGMQSHPVLVVGCHGLIRFIWLSLSGESWTMKFVMFIWNFGVSTLGSDYITDGVYVTHISPSFFIFSPSPVFYFY